MATYDAQTDRERPTTAGMPPVQARQGVISGRVVTVLIVSVTLSVVALIVAYLIFGH